MAFQAADIATEIQAARLLTYDAARKRQKGETVQLEGAMAKLYASRVAERTASWCVQSMVRVDPCWEAFIPSAACKVSRSFGPLEARSLDT